MKLDTLSYPKWCIKNKVREVYSIELTPSYVPGEYTVKLTYETRSMVNPNENRNRAKIKLFALFFSVPDNNEIKKLYTTFFIFFTTPAITWIISTYFYL